MTRGFVTIATGNERYYKMALKLLESYKFFCPQPVPFAIICDRENEYTEKFDNIILMDNPTNSYMDKIRLLEICPYDENIFIDADCLAYRNLNCYWEAFDGAADFSCFGKALPLDSKGGLFKREDVAEWSDKIHFVTHLHGVIYFIRKGKVCLELLETSKQLIESYNNYYFPGFPEPSDESVFALAMAIHNLKPVYKDPHSYIFVPVAEKLDCDILQGKLSYVTRAEGKIFGGVLGSLGKC